MNLRLRAAASLGAAAVVIGTAVFFLTRDSGQAATFTVNSSLDPGVLGCDAVECTLREAITAANSSGGADVIGFSIGSGTQTISPLSPLPDITDTVTIDSTTQPGFGGTPIIEINGTNAGAGADGLRISASTSIVKGLVINRFNGDGIEVFGGGSSAKIEGNYIGTSVSGMSDLGNAGRGVHVNNVGPAVVGGTTTGARNVISGNTSGNILISGAGANMSVVSGNYIGVDAAGAGALITNGPGVSITNTSGNTIGGTAAGARNVISVNPTGVLISGASASGNLVQGNYIGTDASGTVSLTIQNDGVFINGAPNNTIGGTASGAGNVISGNDSDGIDLLGAGTTGTVIQGNLIGTDVTGTLDRGNSMHAVHVDGAIGTIIGGTSSAARNVMSGHGSAGIFVRGTGSDYTTIQGNFIGTDITGTLDVGNSYVGILINGSNTKIGGSSAASGNLISGNNDAGILIAGSGATGTIVRANLVGTDVSGGLPLGNFQDGIRINAISGVVIGGSGPAEGNVIASATSDGIEINPASGTANNTVVQGNYIGTNSSNSAGLGNSLHGVFVNGTSDNTIGGQASGEGNVIKFNGADGVYVGSGTGNSVLSNSIDGNGGLGIDLANDGFTANDIGDGDIGANGLQNFPVLTAAVAGSGTAVQGSLNSTPNTTFVVEYFHGPTCDPSSRGEGLYLLGSGTFTTDGSGNTSVNNSFAPVLPAGQVVTASATDPLDNTSEFSQCVTVTAEATPTPNTSPSPSPSPSPTPSPTTSPSPTPSPSASPSPSPSPTASPGPATPTSPPATPTPSGTPEAVGGVAGLIRDGDSDTEARFSEPVTRTPRLDGLLILAGISIPALLAIAGFVYARRRYLS